MSVCHLVTLIILLLFTDDKVHLMKQNCCVLGQSREHEEDTRQHPGLYSRQPLCLGGVGGNVVKNVDQHQEQGDQESHASRDDIWRNKERYPGDHHEQS